MPDAKRMPTVLIGFAEALSAPEVAWSLIDAGYQVVAFTRRGSKAVLRRCAGVRLIEIALPELDITGAVNDIITVARNISAAAAMPLDDVSVFLCDRAIAQLPCRLIGPSGTCTRMALDKRQQIDRAIKVGFAVPATTIFRSINDVPDAQTFPVIIKAALAVSECDGKTSRFGGSVCADRAELAKVKLHWPTEVPVLIQPFIVGVGEGLFGIADESGIHACSSHRRIRMMNPQGSGSSACRSIPVDTGLAGCAARMLTQCGWRGMFMIEMLRDEAGQSWFMELNGRPWGSMALARRAGFEYPAWAIRMATNADYRPPMPPDNGPLVCRHLGREIVHVLMVLRGPKSVALTKWPSRWRTLCDVLWVRRGEHWYNLRRGNLRVFFTDTVQTVCETIRRKQKAV